MVQVSDLEEVLFNDELVALVLGIDAKKKIRHCVMLENWQAKWIKTRYPEQTFSTALRETINIAARAEERERKLLNIIQQLIEKNPEHAGKEPGEILAEFLT
ncbi:MAG: hypothetical protein ACFFD4_02515 [Candidatus Odinarchaeota archaeon]